MAALRFPTKLFINGQCLAGEGRAEAIINPANGEVLCEVREASADQRRQAVDAASAAFPAWAALTPKDRSGFLLKIADAIETHGDELAMLESLNCCTPRRDPCHHRCVPLFCWGHPKYDRRAGR